jgi:integrase
MSDTPDGLGESIVGHARRRIGADGKPRYLAIAMDSNGRRISVGTFGSKKAADLAWQRAEAKVAEGRLGHPRRGKIRFKAYVETVWLPNHRMEASTRQRYTYSIDKHLIPEFGDMRMVDFMPGHIRAWVTKLIDRGISPSTIADLKTILSAIFTTALNDQVIHLHPCKGVKTPTVAKKARVIITPEQFDAIHQALPDDPMRLLVETAIESGLRWGELTELRPCDLDIANRLLTVSRAAVEVTTKFNPSGDRFLVKDYPKNTHTRRLKLSPGVTRKLADHIEKNEIGPGDLLFTLPPDTEPDADAPAPPPDDLGLTEPNAAGRQYKHATLTGYSLGRCRCQWCTTAYRAYRAARRAGGKDRPAEGNTRNAGGHIPRGWFRKAIWNPALTSADIGTHVRIHDLRHAHASWLLAGGADLQVVKDRLGHGSLRTTERYLHTLPDADETALTALDRMRTRSGR